MTTSVAHQASGAGAPVAGLGLYGPRDEEMMHRLHVELAAPFGADDIEWRVGQSGFKQDGTPWIRALAYLESRAIMARLDAVVGPGNWRVEQPIPSPIGEGMLCGLSIRVPRADGSAEWVTKWDGAEAKKESSGGARGGEAIDRIKATLSNGLKRAGALWGIGRYLYAIPKGYAQIVPKGRGRYSAEVKSKDGQQRQWVDWNPPALPEWALPQEEQRPAQRTAARREIAAGSAPAEPRNPMTAPALTLEQATEHPERVPLPKLLGFREHAGRELGALPMDVLQQIVDSVRDAKPNLAAKVDAVLAAKRAHLESTGAPF